MDNISSANSFSLKSLQGKGQLFILPVWKLTNKANKGCHDLSDNHPGMTAFFLS